MAGGLLIFAVACGGDGVGPTSDAGLEDPAAITPSDPAVTTPTDTATTPPADTAVTVPDSTITLPPDTTGTVPIDVTSTAAGIVFGSYEMRPETLSSVHTGTMLGGPLSPNSILSFLSQIRAKGGRIVIKLCMGRDQYVTNADGTFSFTKWKALVDRFKNVNIGPYIADGTILAHFLIDEPHRDVRWGGKIIPQTTLEAMAAYSKQLWPGMTTVVRVVPSWLASAPVTYKALDAGWLQYAAGKGEAGSMVAAEVAAGKSKGLGLIVGLNVLKGGPGQRAMTASEIRSYGTTLLNQSYACGFYQWKYDAGYYGRADIKAAMADLSAKAKAHVKTSCKQ